MLCGIIGYTRKSSCAISHHLFFDHRCGYRTLPMDSERTTERSYVWDVRQFMPCPTLQAKSCLFHRKRRKTAFYYLHFFCIGRMSIEGGGKVTKQSIVVCDSDEAYVRAFAAYLMECLSDVTIVSFQHQRHWNIFLSMKNFIRNTILLMKKSTSLNQSSKKGNKNNPRMALPTEGY